MPTTLIFSLASRMILGPGPPNCPCNGCTRSTGEWKCCSKRFFRTSMKCARGSTIHHKDIIEARRHHRAKRREVAQAVERSGGGGRTRAYDLRIMSRQAGADSKELQQDSSAGRGKVLQNPQPRRNKTQPKKTED